MSTSALDPVLFRVLFATAAFFGGAGILAYLLAWAAIPEAGTARAAIDGWIGELRRRHVPFWVVAVLAGLFLWVSPSVGGHRDRSSRSWRSWSCSLSR